MRCPSCAHDNPNDARFCNACATPLTTLPVPEREPHDADSSAVPPSPVPASATDGVFVGRERELAELQLALQAALLGQGQTALLVGEPGIGKTRLAMELAEDARLRGVRVLWGSTYEWEGTPAYWPWVQIAREHIRERDPQLLRAELGEGAADIAQIVPELADILPGLPELPRREPEQARFLLFDAVTNFLKRITASQPLVLVLDDLHWADKPSLLLLEFVAREIRRTKLLVLGTYRDVEVGRHHPLAATLAELARAGTSNRVLLRGLTRDDAQRYIALTMGAEPPPAAVDAVYRETEGNPFFLSEIVRLLAAEGQLERIDSPTWRAIIPQSIREVVGRRLDRLSEPTNEALAVAAVAGREFSLNVLERVLHRSVTDLLDTLEEAVRARLVERDAVVGRYRFAHALVQETLYQELSTPRRVRLHAQIGDAIEQLHAANLTPFLEELAQHYFEAAAAGKAEQAIAYLVKAGDAALVNLGFEEAISQYERALQMLDLRGEGGADDERRCEIFLALGETRFRAGEHFAGDATFRRAAEIARGIGRFDLLARAAAGSESISITARPFDAGWDVLIRAALDGMGKGDSILRARLLSRLAVMLFYDPDATEQRNKLINDSVEVARRVADPSTLAYTLIIRTNNQWASVAVEQRLADLDEIFRLTQTVENGQLELWAHVYRFNTMLEAGRSDDADREVQALTALAARTRQPLHLTIIGKMRSALAMLRGDLAEHARWVRENVITLDPAFAELDILHAFRLHLEQNRIHELEGQITEFASSSPRTVFRCARVLAHAYMQQPTDALREFQGLAVDNYRALGAAGILHVANSVLLSEAAWLLGNPSYAGWLYERLLPVAPQGVAIAGGLGFYGSASHYLGLLATTLGRWDDAKRHFAGALEMHERMGARPWAANTRYAWADMLLRRGEPDDRARALEVNAQALAAAETMGMTLLTERSLALKVRLQGMLNA